MFKLVIILVFTTYKSILENKFHCPVVYTYRVYLDILPTLVRKKNETWLIAYHCKSAQILKTTRLYCPKSNSLTAHALRCELCLQFVQQECYQGGRKMYNFWSPIRIEQGLCQTANIVMFSSSFISSHPPYNYTCAIFYQVAVK